MQCAIGMACLWPKFDQASGQDPVVRLLPAAKGDLAGEESQCGFARALGRLSPTLCQPGRAVIVPSASALERTNLSWLVQEAELGSTVLIDLADGFASPSDVARTRRGLERDFGIEIAHPVTFGTADYIVYRWPLPALVRHFTRVSLIQPCRNIPVAHLGAHAIAVRKEIGMGHIVILGSTLGSLLLAGDEQAHQIFACLLTQNDGGYAAGTPADNSRSAGQA
jgi:hypothetical protein